MSTELCKKLEAKRPEFIHDLEKHGVKYVRYMPKEDDATSAIGRGWKSTFLAESKEEAEKQLLALGSSFEWQENECLKTVTATVPAIRTDLGPNRSGEKTFFNSLIAAYTGWNDSRNIGEKAVILGDETGSSIDREAVADTVAIMEEICVAVPWRAGDLLLLDNRTTMHSRRPFEGPRVVLASLVRDYDR